MSENRDGVYFITDLTNALTITSPTLGASGPVPLVATTKSRHSGYNLAVGLGVFGTQFSSSSNSYVWVSQSESDAKNQYFASVDDEVYGNGEPNVWVLGSADSNGRYPISLSFVGPKQSTVTCTRFFDYATSDTGPLVGATCGKNGVYKDFDTTLVRLFFFFFFFFAQIHKLILI